ncbi:uncharacterized protein SPSK_04091 [Sporothrix schenckii 1099-18]|uniref:Uncharacterized protein n=1 Tax=Sporothrix schenckii 1099-18 TaxID=1397361 RepID=A0A0F2M590_SPOSC|nr:uncharacterized protein SPSK_04091 [Sporothrix schenckii 1099-18]KJR83361.1 hypothetical protein SPSK_04091 [Sporothrix schenckii 1099-18]
MVSGTTLSPFERLPHVVLDIICGYLDDESDHRPDLCAFSLTSHRCCAAAKTRRFNQLVLVVPNLDDLGAILADLRAVLGHGERYALVHRLKVGGVLLDGDQRDQSEQNHAEDDDNLQLTERNFDSPPFCHIAQPCRWMPLSSRRGPGIHDDDWLPLAAFLRELPALKDLVWNGRVPRSVLDALHDAKRPCRLHVLGFRLPSLVYDRETPRAISPDDFALVTSPALYSIRAPLCRYDVHGALDYSPEVVFLMMQGLAPNLANVWLETEVLGAGLSLNQSVALGRPAWRGFFLDGPTDEETKLTGGTGSLRNVLCQYNAEPSIFNAQSMANLRRLQLDWSEERILALANLVTAGSLPRLDMLSLMCIHSSTGPHQAAINQILRYTKPLRYLCLTGHVTRETMEIVTRHHGASLRTLSLLPYAAGYYVTPPGAYDVRDLFAFSRDAVELMADRCPHLEEVYVEIQRTRGDPREVAIYRALGKLTRLERVFLRLRCSLPTNDDMQSPRELVTYESLKEIFSNHAMDAALARAIYDVVSPPAGHGPGRRRLNYLRIEPEFVTEVHIFDTLFYDAMHCLGRQWVCQPTKDQNDQSSNNIVVRELQAWETRVAREECLEADWPFPRQHINNYEAMFQDLWPGDGPPWDCWTSLPLQTGDEVSE